MKNSIYIFVLCLCFLSCDTDTAVDKEASKIVTAFLEDVNTLTSDSTGNPVVSFTEQAILMADQSITFTKSNAERTLTTAKDFANAVIVVENHTIVKLANLEDCKPSGSWGVCMPKGEGFIKKGAMNYKSDYIYNIIGKPSDKNITVFLFD